MSLHCSIHSGAFWPPGDVIKGAQSGAGLSAGALR
jgi:hypothetical protein